MAGQGQRKDKLIADALRMAAVKVVEGDPEGRNRLRMAAERVVLAAMDGDLAAFKEMADRLDGKAVQQTEGTIDIHVHDGAKSRLVQKLDRAVNPSAESDAPRTIN